jgi:hypothetical protein
LLQGIERKANRRRMRGTDSAHDRSHLKPPHIGDVLSDTCAKVYDVPACAPGPLQWRSKVLFWALRHCESALCDVRYAASDIRLPISGSLGGRKELLTRSRDDALRLGETLGRGRLQ